jgi:small nuclear ribonucleoprotein (snRNP)-like protein
VPAARPMRIKVRNNTWVRGKLIGRSICMNVILSEAKDQVGTALVSSKLCCRMILRFVQDDIHTDTVTWGMARHAPTRRR